ncbi:hypothetical protein F2Q69_00036654 [Brassica cretica]|uniref:Uncharacterized protein n=1 Tax=Brassica cretica TaxID=69181 RepID=A0A8S9SJY1_BRACR|nr:hypothetical protein F2Q69_00036654 [Brassica cretica]
MDELRAAHGRTRASCYQIVVGCVLNGTRLSGSRAAAFYRVCERLIGIVSWLIGNASWL